jgi:hypothetical protein
MSDPTSSTCAFATAFYVPHHHRLDVNRPAYWKVASPYSDREVWIVATKDELQHWITLLFGNTLGVMATRMRTAVGQPMF